MNKIVVIGGGHASAQFCASMKEAQPESELLMVSDESQLPYQRPPLSKTFLKDSAATPAVLRSAAFYADHGIGLRLNDKATRIDRAARRISLASGESLEYDTLVLATGTRSRALPMFRPDLANVFLLRTVNDAERLRTALHSAQSVVVVGGGYIGLEIAATAAQLGKTVTVMEAATRLLARSSSLEISGYLLEKHRAAGIDVRLGAAIGRIDESGDLVTAVWDGEQRFPADLVILGVGAVPNDELAREAGLECDNGIVVDATMRTADPSILAIGDCTSFPSISLGRHTRLESVQNANDQARTAARTVAGQPEPYSALPWFWSDQGSSRIQIAGLWEPQHRRVLRGDPAQDKFSVMHFDGDLLTSVESINSPADHMAARKLIAAGVRLTPEQAADPAVPLKSFEAAPGA